VRRSHETILLLLGCGSLALAFPPANLWPVGLVGLIPLFHLIGRRSGPGGSESDHGTLVDGAEGPAADRPASTRRSAFRTGFLGGIAFFLPLVYWLVKLSSNEVDNPVLMSGPLVMLVLLQSLYWGLAAGVSRLLIGRGGVPRVLVLPVVWTAFEYLRSLTVLGFPWGNIGYVGTAVPAVIQFASLTGLFGVTFWFALVNAIVLELIEGRRDARARTVALASLLLVLVLPLAHGLIAMSRPVAEGSIRVAVIQPNIEGKKKWDPAFRNLSYERLEKLTREAGRGGPDLIIWPETATPTYLRTDVVQLDWVRRLAADVDAAILTGSPDFEGRPGESPRYYNSALLVRPDSPEVTRYDKIHLVPFGEAIPFESTFPILERVDFGEADFRAGTDRTLFEWRGTTWSTHICYEVIFPGLVREFVDAGAGMLVTITNDVWYGRSSMPFQHAAMARMRSIENRRSLARSANSGISMLVDPRGRVIAQTDIFTETFLVADLPVGGGRTFYTRVGDYPGWLALLLSGVGLMKAVAARPRRP